ncbi:MAG TPA: hypothetical protein VH561_09530 [Micromonosporaceae bacterium]|jgi:hypothetical protein
MTITRVPDEVWRQLDPGAGTLSRRTSLRLWVALAVVLVLLVAGAALWRTGLVVPRLAWPDGPHSWTTQSDEGVVRIDFQIVNDGRFPVTVQSVGRSGPGLELLGVEGGRVENPTPDVHPFPTTLAPGTVISAVLVYRITDCTHIPTGSWPVTAQVHRPWGTMTVDVPEQGFIEPWQTQVFSVVCR